MSAVHENTEAWIRLRDLNIANASVGALPHERNLPQAIRLDVALLVDNARAGHSDALRDTVDYSQVAETLRAVVASKHFVLIEHLAESLVRAVFERFDGVRRVGLEVHKPQALPDGTVSIRLERTR